MGDSNEPRLMKPRREEKRAYSNATGKAGLDGYTRLAGRKHPGNFDPMDGSDQITPNVGERDWSRGPRFSEDF